MKEMTAEREGAILEAAIERWGEEMQIIVAIEELSELQKALTKRLRAGGGSVDCETARLLSENILEEMADVYIMLAQLEMMFGDPTEYEIEKLERLAERVGLDGKEED